MSGPGSVTADVESSNTKGRRLHLKLTEMKYARGYARPPCYPSSKCWGGGGLALRRESTRPLQSVSRTRFFKLTSGQSTLFLRRPSCPQQFSFLAQTLSVGGGGGDGGRGDPPANLHVGKPGQTRLSERNPSVKPARQTRPRQPPRKSNPIKAISINLTNANGNYASVITGALRRRETHPTGNGLSGEVKRNTSAHRKTALNSQTALAMIGNILQNAKKPRCAYMLYRHLLFSSGI